MVEGCTVPTLVALVLLVVGGLLGFTLLAPAQVEVQPPPAIEIVTAMPPEAVMPELPPTTIMITNVLAPGDLDNEAVELMNTGETIDLAGWQIVTEAGNAYTFPEMQFFGGGLIRVFTGEGDDTPLALHWGETSAQWNAGDTVTVMDDSGVLQATFTIGQP